MTFTGAGGGSGAVERGGSAAPVVSAMPRAARMLTWRTRTANIRWLGGSIFQLGFRSQWAPHDLAMDLLAEWRAANGCPKWNRPVAMVSYNYTASTAGNTYVWTLLVSNGYLTASVNPTTVGVEAPPPATTKWPFQAGDGVITFAIRADQRLYFAIRAVKPTQPRAARPSLLSPLPTPALISFKRWSTHPLTRIIPSMVNVDAQPTDPTNIWDIPITSGFVQQIVSWRGNGADGNDQFVPAVFRLAAGTRLQLIIRGRESNVNCKAWLFYAIIWHRLKVCI